MIKILCVFGTRPEAIKMAPVVKTLNAERSTFNVKVCVTAQHRHMLDQVLDIFNIKCDYDLNIMQDSQTLYQITTNGLTKLEKIIQKEKPHLVMVHGDTTTTMVAGLAAFYEKIPVGHIEAGLRSFDKYNPFPEEINRKLVDVLADLYFVPTRRSAQNLLHEGYKRRNMFVCGNTVIDALFLALKVPYQTSEPKLNQIDKNKKIILITAHRRENWGEPLRNICNALKKLAQSFADIQIVYPVHLNPNVKNVVYSILDKIPNVLLTLPLDYLDFINLMKKSYLVLTDSGGLQEEAPSLGKPVLVLRQVTERPEAVEAGTVKVVGTGEEIIYKETVKLLTDRREYKKMAMAVNPYGDGKATQRIIESILWYFRKKKKRPKEFK